MAQGMTYPARSGGATRAKKCFVLFSAVNPYGFISLIYVQNLLFGLKNLTLDNRKWNKSLNLRYKITRNC